MMCGECNWPKTEENKNQFFFRGKHFDTFDEMIEYTKDWMESNCTKEEVDFQFQTLAKEFYLNLHLCGGSLKNKEMMSILNVLCMQMWLQLQKYGKEEKVKIETH